MKDKGYLAIVLFVVCTFVSGAYYSDYICFDLEQLTWLREDQLNTLAFVSMSCIPTGLTYAFRDLIQLYLGRKTAILSVVFASIISMSYAVYASTHLTVDVYREIIISGMVFLGIEGIDQLTYEWLEKKAFVFWKRLAVSGLVSGLFDAVLWKTYLDILNPLSVVVSGLTMFLPAFIIALFFIKYKVQERVIAL